MKIWLTLFTFVITTSYAQLNSNSAGFKPEPLRKVLKVDIKKTGAYLGYARGRVDAFEIGAEMQHQKFKLIKPPTHAYHMGLDYNFKYNVLGYEAGYWYRAGRLHLTYGGNIVLRTDFTYTRLGIGPAIGFKLLGFHLQTGYNFLTRSENFTRTNDFFIRLRFVLLNDLDVKIHRE